MKARQEESNIATDRASTKQKYNARSRPHPCPNLYAQTITNSTESTCSYAG